MITYICLPICLPHLYLSMYACLAIFLSPRPGDIGFGGRVCPSLVPPDRSLPRLLRPIFRLFPAQNPATHEDPHLRRTARPAQRHSRSIYPLTGPQTPLAGAQTPLARPQNPLWLGFRPFLLGLRGSDSTCWACRISPCILQNIATFF